MRYRITREQNVREITEWIVEIPDDVVSLVQLGDQGWRAERVDESLEDFEWTRIGEPTYDGLDNRELHLSIERTES
jgi:hypothetical protein